MGVSHTVLAPRQSGLLTPCKQLVNRFDREPVLMKWPSGALNIDELRERVKRYVNCFHILAGVRGVKCSRQAKERS